jgi:hypothetical protein
MSESSKQSQSPKLRESLENDYQNRLKLLREKEVIIGVQVRKLHEMRTAQVAFFDTKMMELRETEVRIDQALEQLRKKEVELDLKQKFVEELIERLRSEKEEIGAIKQLLRTETESAQIQSRDLRRIVQRYEKYLSPITTKAPGLVSQ